MKVHAKSLTHSTVLTIALITLITVWSEMSKPLKDFLAGITGHHWVTKGVLAFVFFIVLYLVFSKLFNDYEDINKQGYYIIGAAILGGLIIFIFYVWHFFA